MPLMDDLKAMIEDAAQGLASVRVQKMFGCPAFFARDKIFALVWKQGRIGVKLPDSASYHEALALDGAGPWQIGPKKMGAWVLLPESVHDDGDQLSGWLARAHGQAINAPAAKKKPAAKKPAAKKPAAKKPAAKKNKVR